MKITESIINDLMPAYLSGEASEDTINLIKIFYKENPEKQEPESLNTEKIHHKNLNLPSELVLLERTKKMLKVRSLLFGLAIFFSAIPFSFGDVSWDDADGVNWLWASLPEGAYVSAGLAACLWVGYLSIQKRLKVSGL